MHEIGVHFLRSNAAQHNTTTHCDMSTGNNSGRSVRKGDIVWVRVQFPHKWCPALVLSSSNLGISVSFFNNNDNDSDISTWRTCFVESEVFPFEDAFPSLMSLRHHHGGYDEPWDKFGASVHSALTLFGLRVVSSLRCRCLTGQSDRVGSGHRFDPNEVLGFVLDVAVLPWVEPPRFVDAVRVVAQIHGFRAYSSIHHKRLHRETQKTGENVKQHQCSSLVEKMHSVSQESDPSLVLKENYQIIFKKGEKNVAIGTMRRLKSTFPVLEGNSEHMLQNKLLIIPEAPTNNGKAELPMHAPALDPFNMVGESLKSERQSLLRFKNTPDQGIVDIRYGNGFRLPDIETTINLNRKRRRLDKPVLCHVFPQIGRVQESEGNGYISKYTRPRISRVKILEPEESIQKDNQAYLCFCETSRNFSDEVQKLDLRKYQNLILQQPFTCESSSNLMLGFHSDNCEVDASAAEVKCTLGSDSSDCQQMLQKSCNGDTTDLEYERSARMKLFSGARLVEGEDCYQCVASCSIFNSKAGQQSKAHVPFSSTSLYMKFPKNFNLPSKGKLIKKFRVFGSINSSKTRVFDDTGSARVAFFQEDDAVAAYLYAKKKVWFGEANIRFWLDPLKHKRRGFKHFSLMPPSASKTIGPPLKSCLKNSNSLRQENRKKHCKVRFTI